jgi:hypothetical protein
MDMTTSAFRDVPVTARAILDDPAGAPRDVAELVRQCSQLDGRQGFRVVARGLSGHIFFERGRVIHAEFGEDVGLRAVNEMLRAGAVTLEAAASWPSQASLHLGPDLLLSMTGKDASRVMRKVDFPVEPPPLPGPEDSDDEDHRAFSERGAPARTEALRSADRRAISGVMPRVLEPPEAAGGRKPSSGRGFSERAVQGLALPEPPPPPASRAAPRPLPEHPIIPARQARSRSIVAARSAESAAALEAARAVPPGAPIQAPRGQQPTTMVRIASRGDLLAAHGENAEQLAEAAAFIHGLANLIAADFGRQGRANVHLSGGGVSLLVARSEVNDIAAALGPTERISSLLGKVGLK